jgi:hypothetical protein
MSLSDSRPKSHNSLLQMPDIIDMYSAQQLVLSIAAQSAQIFANPTAKCCTLPIVKWLQGSKLISAGASLIWVDTLSILKCFNLAPPPHLYSGERYIEMIQTRRLRVQRTGCETQHHRG